LTYSEFKRWLLKQGCKFAHGKGSHKLIELGGRVSTFPDHGKKEMKKGLVEGIKKDLGLK
jgi:mRNA interferase HicA